jgi:predicted glycoside hydrolase/deacetylase ChbG (UPF0249 family)
MALQRQLIVNADDFGQSVGINQGIIATYEMGIVTSTSLMVRWPAAAEAADYARTNPGLSVGLHLDLGEWIYRDESWGPVYEVAPTDDAVAVRDEVTRQLLAFRNLMGRQPTHLDSHQHVHRQEPVRSILIGIAHDLRIPLRHFSTAVRYCGSFYGQTAHGLPFPEGVSVLGLLNLLAALAPGVTELGCHPGCGTEVESMYRTERAEEVKTLCDPRVRAAVAAGAIGLCSFHALLGAVEGREPEGR